MKQKPLKESAASSVRATVWEKWRERGRQQCITYTVRLERIVLSIWPNKERFVL